MAMLPNVDWEQFATKADLDALEQRLEAHMERTLRKAIVTQTRWLVAAVATLMLGMIGSTAALVQAILSRVPVLPAG